jgi:hypothetical protein
MTARAQELDDVSEQPAGTGSQTDVEQHEARPIGGTNPVPMRKHVRSLRRYLFDRDREPCESTDSRRHNCDETSPQTAHTHRFDAEFSEHVSAGCALDAGRDCVSIDFIKSGVDLTGASDEHVDGFREPEQRLSNPLGCQREADP